MLKNIGLEGLFISYGLIIIILIVSYFEKLRMEKDILFSFLRMSIQLFIAGIVLNYVFKLDSCIVNLIIFISMIYFASSIVIRRSGVKMRNIALYVFVSIFLATGIILTILLFAVIRIKGLEARYFVVLAGMVVGNSMNSATIGIERFFSSYKEQKGKIEDLIGLGASKSEALKFIGRDALRASVLPSLASASGMGIVFLPGMMTGQILSGVNPSEAVFYQISIVIAITSTVILSNYIMLKFLIKNLNY